MPYDKILPAASVRTVSNVGFRRVGPADYPSTRRIVVAAFGIDGADTAVFLDALRADGCIVGEWMAGDRGEPIGYAAFSRVWLEQRDGTLLPCVMLTPLAVRPDRQGVGVASGVMNHALRQLERQGESVFFVSGIVGFPKGCPRFSLKMSPRGIVRITYPVACP
jgi:putative acetyltransferase